MFSCAHDKDALGHEVQSTKAKKLILVKFGTLGRVDQTSLYKAIFHDNLVHFRPYVVYNQQGNVDIRVVKVRSISGSK